MESSGSNRALCDQLIRIETGWIRSISEDDAESCVWREVPYAKAKRWLASQRADDWDGVLDMAIQCLEAASPDSLIQKFSIRILLQSGKSAV